jgi:glycosyltransferase involved in cell wall biosynthesis
MAFKNEKVKPALVLKTSSAGFSVMDRETTIKKIREVLGNDYKSVPIYLLHGDLTPVEMNGLYEHPKVKAMLNFTKGEGFGRPLLEFSLTGKPVIVSNWSGHLDFLKQGAVLLEGELKPVHESAADQFLLKESQWFNVNISKALSSIKDVYKNYEKYKKASIQLGKQNKQNFGLEKMTKLFDGILNQYGIYSKIQPKFQQLQLPKLKMLSK